MKGRPRERVGRAPEPDGLGAPHRDEPAAGGVQDDPDFGRFQALMQQGLWPEAQRVLTALEWRHPASGELQRAWELLAFRLSAEETWSRAASHRLGSWLREYGRLTAMSLRRPAIRFLLVGNFVVYVVLAVLWVFEASNGLLP